MDNQPPVPIQPQGPTPTLEVPPLTPQTAAPFQPTVVPTEPVAPTQTPLQPTPGTTLPVTSPQGSYDAAYQITSNTTAPVKRSSKKLLLIAAVIFLILAGTVAAVVFRPKKSTSKSANAGTTSQVTKTAAPIISDKTFKVVRSNDYSDVCSGNGWPSNAQSSPSGKITDVNLERASHPGSYAEYSFDVVKPEQDVSNDAPTTVDRVACMQIDSKEQDKVECKFTGKAATMILKDYKVVVYDLKSKSKIAEFSLPASKTCPTVAFVAQDNTIPTKVDFAASSKKFSEL
jgi:hypothetical protein